MATGNMMIGVGFTLTPRKIDPIFLQGSKSKIKKEAENYDEVLHHCVAEERLLCGKAQREWPKISSVYYF